MEFFAKVNNSQMVLVTISQKFVPNFRLNSLKKYKGLYVHFLAFEFPSVLI